MIRRWPGLRLFTLRSKLQAAFALVIVVALGTAAAGTFGLIQRYQRDQALDQLQDIATIAAGQMARLTLRQASPNDIAGFMSILSHRYDVRILLLDGTNRILVDVNPNEDQTFLGLQLQMPVLEIQEEAAGGQPRRPPLVAWTAEPPPLALPHLFIAADVRPLIRVRARAVVGLPLPAGAAIRRVAVTVPEASVAMAWRALAPSLAIAALIALGVSAAAALWLSRSIARPLRQISHASQAMAQGNYEQSIPVRGHDEVAQLARAFNQMASEVDRSNRALRAFLANASHELRTPLTSLQGWAQALVEGEVRNTDETVQAGRIIHDEAERMRRLVESLLYLSKIEGGQHPVERDAVDLRELLGVTLSRIRPLAVKAGQKLVLRANTDPVPPVLGDPRLLERLFANLTENASKYASYGAEITISVRFGSPPDVLTSRGRNGVTSVSKDVPAGQDSTVVPGQLADTSHSVAAQSLWVRVHNTGSLIPATDLPHIFERFYRVEKSRAKDVDGTGLGLAIAREIIAAHDGEIRATSSAKDGTSFTVTLPAANASAPFANERSPRGSDNPTHTLPPLVSQR